MIELRLKSAPSKAEFVNCQGQIVLAEICPVLAIGEPSIVLDLVLRGLGIGTVPLVYASEGLRSGELASVLPQFTRGKRPIYAVYPSRRQLSPKVRVFIDFVTECLASTELGWQTR